MHSYIDVSMVLIFSCVIALLALILISFILSARRAKDHEKRLDELEKKLSNLAELVEKIGESSGGADTRIKVLERSSQYFADHAQHFIDVQKAYDVSINSLKVETASLGKDLKELKKELLKQQQERAQAKSESQERIENLAKRERELAPGEQISANQNKPKSSEQSARELLKQGLDEQEVISRTGLPAGEVDMISKMLQPNLDDTPELRPSLKKQSRDESKESAKPHMVASLKARNAYGMSLRRR